MVVGRAQDTGRRAGRRTDGRGRWRQMRDTDGNDKIGGVYTQR